MYFPRCNSPYPNFPSQLCPFDVKICRTLSPFDSLDFILDALPGRQWWWISAQLRIECFWSDFLARLTAKLASSSDLLLGETWNNARHWLAPSLPVDNNNRSHMSNRTLVELQSNSNLIIVLRLLMTGSILFVWFLSYRNTNYNDKCFFFIWRKNTGKIKLISCP